MLGFNPKVFLHTIENVDGVRKQVKTLIQNQLNDMMGGDEDHNQSAVTFETLVQSLADMDLRLDNLKYEKHDKENSFVGQFTKQAVRSLKQWKEGLSEPVWTIFIQVFADRLSD